MKEENNWFTSKPYELEAMQFTGDNIDDIIKFVGEENVKIETKDSQTWEYATYSILTADGWTTLFDYDYVIIDQGNDALYSVVDQRTFERFFEKTWTL